MNEAHTAQHRILPLRLYLGVGTILLILTGVTVLVAQFHLGPLNLVVAMLVAAVKASLVALFFMHLRYDNKMYMAVFVGSLIFLAVLITFTMFDTLRRGDIYDEISRPINSEAIIYQSAGAADSTQADSAAAGHGEAEQAD